MIQAVKGSGRINRLSPISRTHCSKSLTFSREMKAILSEISFAKKHVTVLFFSLDYDSDKLKRTEL